MPDELVSISLAVSSALVIALCSLGGWLARSRHAVTVPAADDDLQLRLDRALAGLGLGAEDTALARAVDAVLADLEPATDPTSIRRSVVTMRSLLHPGSVVSLAMGRPQWAAVASSPDAPARPSRTVALFPHAPPVLPRVRSAKGSTPPPRREFADELSTVQDVLLQRLGPRSLPRRVRRERPVH